MIKTEHYKDLTKMNTFGMKVKARCFMEYDSVVDLVDIEFAELARPVLHVGGGSNLLFTDDFKGTVLHSKINFIEILDDTSVRSSDDPYSRHSEVVGGQQTTQCVFAAKQPAIAGPPVLVSVGAGVVFDDFCEWAAKEGLWGVENLSYIPGEVGASAVQNIGAYGVEVKDVIHRVYCYDTLAEEFVNFSVEECGYGYRDSIFKKPEVKGRYIVTHVVFALSREPKPCLEYGHLKEAVYSHFDRTSDCHFNRASDCHFDRTSDCHSDRTSDCHSDRTSDCHFDRAERVEKSLTPSLIRKTIIKIRKEKLPEPSVVGSAGSFFKNPVITMEHFARIEAAAKAEYGPDFKVPHYIIETECHGDGDVTVIPSKAEGRVEVIDAVAGANAKESMVKIPAAWLIEQCGWKGRRSGGAAVWEKQPLVIVNYTGEAYPEEIIGLEKRIIASVKTKFGIDLHPEVEHV